MLKIKDDVDLKELEKFDYKKNGGTEKYWHFYYYTKEIYGIMNWYLIKIDGKTRKIEIFKDLAVQHSSPFNNVESVKKNRLIKDIIKADMVEKVQE